MVRNNLGKNEHPRMKRERITIKIMIEMFCNKKHSTKNAICKDCSALLEYSMIRLDKCTFQDEKPTCGTCTVHCYQDDYRTKIKEIMRYSGKRILFKHPILTIKYLKDRRKSKKKLKEKKNN